MPAKLDESSPGIKTLKIFRKLLLNGCRHYQADLAAEFNCSSQTILRIMSEIEMVIGENLEMGLDNRRKWYRITPKGPMRPGLDVEELRYLAVCRDLAAPTLPNQILDRVNQTIFSLYMQMRDPGFSKKEVPRFYFYNKGRIDYTPFYPIIETLMQACENKIICEMSYRAVGKDAARTHRVAPNCLVSMHQALYLLGAILTDDNEVKHFASFAVQRIKKCFLSADKFQIEFPSVNQNSFGLPWHEPRSFKIRFKAGKAADYVAERIWSDEQKLEYEENGNLILHITTQSEPELRAWLRSFGDAAEMLEEEMRKKLNSE